MSSPSSSAGADLVRVRIVQRGEVLGEEAVAATRIEAGTPVIDEAPLLVLPHYDASANSNPSSSSSSSSPLSPAKQLCVTLQKHSQMHNGSSQEKQDDISSSNNINGLFWKSAADTFAASVAPALEKVEVIAQKHGLAPGYFAPLVMAHYTMTRDEIKEIVACLISHVNIEEDDATGERAGRRNNFGFEPLQLVERELSAGDAVVTSLATILVVVPSEGSNTNNNSAGPTSDFWLKEVLSAAANNTQQQPKKKQQSSTRSNNNSNSVVVRALLKWLHGVRINVHSDDVHRLTAVFRHACKCNHSCKPNTFWFLSSAKMHATAASSSSSSSSFPDQQVVLAQKRQEQQASVAGVHFPALRAALKRLIGNAVHIATRDIEPGEPTTFSYVGCGLNMLSPATIRRQSLSHLHFVCACQRCSDYDRGAKQELALRPLICGNCFNRGQQQQNKIKNQAAAPPQLSDFVSLVQFPSAASAAGGAAAAGAGWKCMKCGYEPQYDDLTESMFHEAIHVDQIMATFFQKTPATSSNSSIRSLPELWACLQFVTRQLTSKHYICAVGAASFLSQMVAQLQAGLVNFETLKKQLFSPSPNQSPAGGSGPSTLFVSCVMQTLIWFQSTMPGTPQHVRFQIAVVTLVEMMTSKKATAAAAAASSSSNLLAPEEVDMMGKMVAGFASGGACARLSQFSDMTR